MSPSAAGGSLHRRTHEAYPRLAKTTAQYLLCSSEQSFSSFAISSPKHHKLSTIRGVDHMFPNAQMVWMSRHRSRSDCIRSPCFESPKYFEPYGCWPCSNCCHTIYSESPKVFERSGYCTNLQDSRVRMENRLTPYGGSWRHSIIDSDCEAWISYESDRGRNKDKRLRSSFKPMAISLSVRIWYLRRQSSGCT